MGTTTAVLQAHGHTRSLWMLLKSGIAGLLLCLMSASGVILMHASKTGGEYTYNFSTVILLAEGLKLVVSGILLLRELKVGSSRVKMTKKWRVSGLYLVPSVIYAVQNNIQFMIVKHVEPITYELFRNINILSTACLSRLFLKRELSKVQWVALLLITIGISSTQLTCSPAGYSRSVRGGLWALASAFLSALAGVYTEKVMKQFDDCIHWQNAQLYAYGLICNAVILVFRSRALPDLAFALSPGVLFKNFGLSAVSSRFQIRFTFTQLISADYSAIFFPCLPGSGSNPVRHFRSDCLVYFEIC